MLQNILREEFGKRLIDATSLPEYFSSSLNPTFRLRPYQEECFRYFLTYWNLFTEKEESPHLLFHMATGSGKTLIMAGLMLYLYEKGYRNFLFFVNSTNVIEKTKDNFLNKKSSKYLFGEKIQIGGKDIEIKCVDNFQATDANCINLCLTTIQGLHYSLNNPKENGVTYDDFSDKRIVLISDEAHHMHAAARNGVNVEELIQNNLFNQNVIEDVDNWETTVELIFRSNSNNVLLEFTATADLGNPVIAAIYENRCIFNYPLKKFREDGYSKDIFLVQSDLAEKERIVQAILLNQYKRKLFARIGENIKPVMMLKSKRKSDNKRYYSEFIDTVNGLTEEVLLNIKNRAKGDLKDLFIFLQEEQISLENFITEIKEDFDSGKLLLVDTDNISPDTQKLLNSLEDANNEIRVIFAVDMLNEGWDVLNLFDIVRTYNTRDGGTGPTTIKEAQLIGRGARYMPFSVERETSLGAVTYTQTEASERNVRKFDGDIHNRLRILETMHYHSKDNNKYIADLKAALVGTGIMAERVKEVDLKLKESFKNTSLYKEGCILLNKQVSYITNDEGLGFSNALLHKTFTVKLFSKGTSIDSLDNITGSATPNESYRELNFKLAAIGFHVLRAAANRIATYTFENLRNAYTRLGSMKEFIGNGSYLGGISVSVYTSKNRLEDLEQSEKLFIATEVLRQIDPLLMRARRKHKGSNEFYPERINKIFHDHTQKFSLDINGEKELGISMAETSNRELRMDLTHVDWHAYNDCYGTSEEKYLIRYIQSIYDSLAEQYDDIYLLRNEKDFKLYSFETGEAYQPDYVLCMKKKNGKAKVDSIQIFIEPKGKHLRATDKWKEDALKAIHEMADVRWSTKSTDFNVWGMPFYTKELQPEFTDAIKKAIEL